MLFLGQPNFDAKVVKLNYDNEIFNANDNEGTGEPLLPTIYNIEIDKLKKFLFLVNLSLFFY